jgi:nucleotide-binding universal stress UspA family protein
MTKRIQVPIDVHEDSTWRDVLPIALDQARHTGAELHVMTVVEPVQMNMPGVPSPEVISQQMQTANRERLEALVESQNSEGMEVSCIVAEGNVPREILRVADELGATLIIMASHRPDLRTYLLGAHAARVVRHANCSVYVVRS